MDILKPLKIKVKFYCSPFLRFSELYLVFNQFKKNMSEIGQYNIKTGIRIGIKKSQRILKGNF